MVSLDLLADILRAVRPAQVFDGNPDVWIWSGPTTTPDPAKCATEVIGLGGPSPDEIRTVQRAAAERWLSLFARSSLLHRVVEPETKPLQKAITDAFNELGPDARFYSNGMWTFTRGRSLPEVVQSTTIDSGRRQHDFQWQQNSFQSRIPNAIKDGGIVGIGANYSFVFWVSEDD
jgi:hypothetical protein